MSEQRDANVMINLAGGNASKSAVNYRVTIPNKWASELEITKENRSVTLTFTDDKKIIIEKA